MDGHNGVASYEASTEEGLVGHIRNSSTLKTNTKTKCLTCTLETPDNAYVNEIERKKADIVYVGKAIRSKIIRAYHVTIVVQDPY